MPRWLTTCLQIAVSLGLLGALLAFVDWSAIRGAVAAVSTGTIVLLLIVCWASQIMFVVRWRALLEVLNISEPWMRSWHTVFAGLFVTNFLPGTLGSDGLRALQLAKSSGRPSTAIGTVAYERIMQLALYLGLLSIAALLPMPWLQTWVRATVALVGAGAILILVLVLSWLGGRASDERPPRGGVIGMVWRLFAGILGEAGRMQARMRRHRSGAVRFVLANLGNVVLVFALWWIALRAVGYDLGIPVLVLAVSAAVVVGAIPISLAGIGVYEGTAVALFGLAGMDTSHAVLAALIVRATFLASSLVGLPSVIQVWRGRREVSPSS